MEREIRILSNIYRWAVVPTIRRQSVAEHSFFVACLVSHLCRETGIEKAVGVTRDELVQAALFHDLDEVITGDIPGPTYRVVKSAPSWKEWLTMKVRMWFPWIEEPKKPAFKVVQLCDCLEAFLFLREEVELGNSGVTRNLDSVYEVIIKLTADHGQDVKDWVNSVIEGHGVGRRILK